VKAENRKLKAESDKHFHGARLRVSGFCFLLSAFCFQLCAFAQPTNDIPPLSPAYPEIPPTFWEQHGTTLGLAIIAALVIIGVLVWLLSRKKPVSPVPPEIQARRALEVLRQRNEDGVVLSEVSQVLRRYLVAAFEMPPEQLTTTEFCAAMDRNEKAGTGISIAVAEFLRRCDERKFSPVGGINRLNAAARALELIELGETRRAHLLQLATAQAKSESSRA
jgi:hypothetical protein